MTYPSPPHPVPTGQAVAWSTASTVTYGPVIMGATNGSATATLTTAALTLSPSRPVGNDKWYALWTGFTVPTSIPTGSVIQAVYPVLTAYGAIEVGEADSIAGPSVDVTAPEPAGLDLNMPNTATTFIGEYFPGSFGSLGNNSAAITSTLFCARVFSTLFSDQFNALNVTFAGLAVYYTPPPLVFGHQPVISVNVGNTRKL